MAGLFGLIRRGFAWTFLPCALLAAGCAHPCGYVDVRARLLPQGQIETSREPAAKPLKIVNEVSPEDPLLLVRVEQSEISMSLAIQERYGRRVCVSYQWYAPVVKPLAAATLVVPFWLSARDPHAHGGGTWGVTDYLRDVLSWYNPFTAIPTGRRKIAKEETLITSRVIWTALAEERVPLPGRNVALQIGDLKRAEKVSKSEGMTNDEIPNDE